MGTPVAEVSQEMDASEAVSFLLKQLSDGLRPSELHKMRQPEAESQRLKLLLADLSLNKALFHEVRAETLTPA
jgi:putative transposase